MTYATLCSGIGAPECAIGNSMAVPCVRFIYNNLKEANNVY